MLGASLIGGKADDINTPAMVTPDTLWTINRPVGRGPVATPRAAPPVLHQVNLGIPSGRVDVDTSWADLACSPSYTWECDWVLATIDCESSGNPEAHAVEWLDLVPPWGELERYDFYGLMQVRSGSTVPDANLDAAHLQYDQWQRGQRSNPWPSCP